MSIAASKKYFKLERRRVSLAVKSDFLALKNTYRSDLKIPDFNSPEFWDEKFSLDGKTETHNPMELDRNITASKWYKSLSKETENWESLNIGCGDGNFEQLIYEYNSENKIRHTAIDMAMGTVNTLREKFPKFAFKIKNVIKDEIGINRFNLVSLFEVLEHINPNNTLPLLAKIYNSVKSNGYFMISVPMNEGLEEMFPNNPNGHLRCYSKELILAELKMTGFEVLKFELFFAFSSYYFLKKIAAKYFLKKKWKPNNILILCRKSGS